jgi:hypothetical protein
MRRYERFSILLTSNRPVEDWGKLLGDVAAVSAMLDRLLHHATSSSAVHEVGAPRPRRHRKEEQLLHCEGSCPRAPGIYRFPARNDRGTGGFAPPAIPALDRRSGRVPALPL